MHYTNIVSFRVLAVLLLVLGLAGAEARAATQIDIYGSGQNLVNLALATPLVNGAPATGLGRELDRAVQQNLSFMPFMRLTDPQAVLGGTALPGHKAADIDFRRFQLAGADLLVTAGWPGGEADGSAVEMSLYETSSGQAMFTNTYPAVSRERIWETADSFCADLMQALTGNGDFFKSTLVFIKSGNDRYRKDVWMSKPTGRDIRQVTNIPGTALSPAWSRDGRFVVFTHIDKQSHSLGVWDRQGNRLQRIRFPGNMVVAPSFTPDNKVAVSLATTDYPDIYLLDHRFQRERTLEAGASINIAPTFDHTGTKMAFCSSRLGGPQVFLKDMTSGGITRISRQGSYNTEPFISPDGTLVAFSRRTDQGHRIFVYDIVTGFERQVTFGPGDDEQPSFAPDSYFLAFSSTRNGASQIYLTTRHGGDAKLVPTGGGEASFPRWGILPQSR